MSGTMQTDRETDTPDGTSYEDDPALDPRIQDELDKLNQASTEINRLENELDEARTKYRITISEISSKLESLKKSQKRCITKARKYYTLEEEKKLAQSEALKAARQYQTATGIYRAAKETVALAEQRLIEKDAASAAHLNSAWQETLNHAISKVMKAELEKTRSEQEHKKRASKFAELESQVQFHEKKFKRSIKNARPYFELKTELDLKLMQQKQNVNDLHAAIKSNKVKYTESLRTLEKISEEIHQSRRSKLWTMVPRMPCVGAETETDSTCSSLSGFAIDTQDGSVASYTDDDSDDSGNKDDVSSSAVSNSLSFDVHSSDADDLVNASSVRTQDNSQEIENAYCCQDNVKRDNPPSSEDCCNSDSRTQDNDLDIKRTTKPRDNASEPDQTGCTECELHDNYTENVQKSTGEIRDYSLVIGSEAGVETSPETNLSETVAAYARGQTNYANDFATCSTGETVTDHHEQGTRLDNAVEID